jgi:hypothetical protein
MTHIAFILLALYCIVIALIYGVQKSISDTFYRTGQRYYFTVTMMLVAFLLMAGESPNAWFVFGAFFLGLQGVAANFKFKPAGIVHVGGVLISIGLFLTGITIQNRPIGVAAIILGLLSYYLLRNVKNSTWWREVAIAIIIYISLIII